MSGREFVDTNILVYAFDRSAGAKRTMAAALMERLWSERRGCVSVQVLQEFYVTATRLGMPPGDALSQVERLGKWTVHRPGLEDLLDAIQLQRQKQVSFWDAMIVTSGLKLGCSLLWSEDLSTGQRWGGLTVKNPFTDPHG